MINDWHVPSSHHFNLRSVRTATTIREFFKEESWSSYKMKRPAQRILRDINVSKSVKAQSHLSTLDFDKAFVGMMVYVNQCYRMYICSPAGQPIPGSKCSGIRKSLRTLHISIEPKREFAMVCGSFWPLRRNIARNIPWKKHSKIIYVYILIYIYNIYIYIVSVSLLWVSPVRSRSGAGLAETGRNMSSAAGTKGRFAKDLCTMQNPFWTKAGFQL